MTTFSPSTQRTASLSIAIVGAGPTAVYLLNAFQKAGAAHRITLFEAGDQGGPGIPFSHEHNGENLLANIAGFELPPVCETLNQWALRQDLVRMHELGIAQSAGDDRAFFPRRALGQYYADQLAILLDHDGSDGRITMHTHADVRDIAALPDRVTVTWNQNGQSHEASFDKVIIASGYGQADKAKPLAGEVAQDIAGDRIAVLGSSLSAIDAAVEIAMRRGAFESADDGLTYSAPSPWHISFLSRRAILPEADFWVPAHNEAMPIFNLAAIEPLAQGRDGDLDRIFALFSAELMQADPDYAQSIDLSSATPDNFADRYFAARMACDPFDHARANLAEARTSHEMRQASPWRYALLQAHSIFAQIVPQLSAHDLDRFVRGLKRCFVDNYAAVPHLSVERMLALHDAGYLSVHQISVDHWDNQTAQDRWSFVIDGKVEEFDDVIDARGQPALGINHLPFPSLRLQLCSQANAQHRDWDDGIIPTQGFMLDQTDQALSRVHALCLPFLLRRHPFIQGLTESAAMAQSCVDAIQNGLREAAPDLRQKTLDALAWMDLTTLIFQGDKMLPILRSR